ncbi:hypothetical protein QR680_009710 [Steinernema hermaphroditum]|uniref:BTB domain-containing protein n=1 Tax=Steinernema hermaphroditum TaxID=289476 RepID=A0AA39M9Y9_9BILA|nr:hypothetical protein QR680_009710 [Steinernema hermaphroditum]
MVSYVVIGHWRWRHLAGHSSRSAGAAYPEPRDFGLRTQLAQFGIPLEEFRAIHTIFTSMDSPGTSSQASTPTMNRRLLQCDEVVFRYRWPVRVSQRVINAETGDTIILNISQPFCTSCNGVVFTWTLRLHDDYALDDSGGYDGDGTQVNVSLYFKDGPGTDVSLNGVSIAVADSDDRPVFSNMRIGAEEWTKGSGWPVRHTEVDGQNFSNFIRQNVGNTVYITADLKFATANFQPLDYLPSLNTPSGTLELMCEELVAELVDKSFQVPEVEFLDPELDAFAIHRKVFLSACEEITKRFNETSYSGKLNPKTIQNILAHSYFKKLMMPKMDYIEELVRALEGVIDYHIPPLKREIERFICNNMLVESSKGGGLQYVQQALLLATRYDLAVVKMMASGIILDTFNIEDNVSYIREELSQVAVQLPFRPFPLMSDDDESSADEMLVGSVVDQLQLLSRRMRRVSISPCQSSSAPSTPLALSTLVRPRTASNTPSTCSNSSSSEHSGAVRSTKIGRFHSETLITPTSTTPITGESGSDASPPLEAPKPVFQRTTPRRMQRIIIADVEDHEPSDLLDSVFSEESLILPLDDQLTIGRSDGISRISF